MSNIVYLKAAREIRGQSDEDLAYHARILAMDKVELLEEMVRFQEERSKLGHLTLPMMVRGKLLFKALEQSAETHELQLLARSYRRHLECEMAEYAKRPERAAAGAAEFADFEE